MDRLRVLIAEDQALIRDALVTLLSQEPDLEVVAAMGRGDEALQWLLAHDVDVAVLDNHMPGREGLDVAAELRARGRTTAVIIVSGDARPDQLHQAMGVPILGFASKGITGTQLASAIRTVAAGQPYLDSGMVMAALAAQPNPLRQREIEVLQMVARGESTKQVARQLLLSPGTVRNYVSASCVKLGASNKIAAVRIAQEAGWI